jgi:lipopolysaccharide transport system ATP-binding protein
MSSDPTAVIKLEGVSKAYPTWAGRGRSVRDVLARRVPLAHRHGRRQWSLRDVTLSVGAGESVGLIGGNGAGKSTLLRVASGLTRPSTGRATVPDGTAAVLTLGESFAPDLTGEENAITTAVVSGFTSRQARALLPEILAYAELEDAADSPVRTYSEGMKLRLAFAVVAQLRPTALLLDEVMTVGDLSFQRKAAARVREAREAGAAVLLATHDLDRLVDECDRAVWLEHGRVHRTGPPEEVVAEYGRAMMDETARRTPSERDDGSGLSLGAERLGSQEATIEDVVLVTGWGSGQRAVLRPAEALEVGWTLRARSRLPVPPVVAVVIIDAAGRTCCSVTTERDGEQLAVAAGERAMRLHLERLDLVPGRYAVEIGVYRDDWAYAYDLHSGAYELEVLGAAPPSGVIAPPRRWETG